METIKTKPFTLSVSEMAQAFELSRRNLSRKKRNIFNLFIILVVVFVVSPIAIVIPVAIFLPSERQPLLDFILFILKWLGVALVFFYLVMPLLLRFRIWISKLKNPKLYKQERIVAFSEQGVDFLLANANSHTDWSYYQSYFENKAFFLLTYGDGMFYPIPKISLEQEQIDAVRDLIIKHVGKLSTE